MCVCVFVCARYMACVVHTDLKIKAGLKLKIMMKHMHATPTTHARKPSPHIPHARMSGTHARHARTLCTQTTHAWYRFMCGVRACHAYLACARGVSAIRVWLACVRVGCA